jgi:hypothetical protein
MVNANMLGQEIKFGKKLHLVQEKTQVEGARLSSGTDYKSP